MILIHRTSARVRCSLGGAIHSLAMRGAVALIIAVMLCGSGSPVSADSPDGVASAAQQPAADPAATHWAFRPIMRPALPVLPEHVPCRTPVDALVAARLAGAGLAFSPPASKEAWLRRVTLDLLGLPPTVEELDAFLADDAPDAHERVVDRLLASPAYGERWARVWLDVVRYADTAGYNADPARPLAFHYRDYVIRSLNSDKPYDGFVAEQLAGDEIAPHDREALVATGFLVQHPDESNASNVEFARQELLNDLTGNVAATFLGLTLGCAQCHDHKFEPLTQEDFFRLQATFAGVVPQTAAPIGTPAELLELAKRRTNWLEESAAVRRELHAIELVARRKIDGDKRLKFSPRVWAALDAMFDQRTAYDHQLVFFSERQRDKFDDAAIDKALDETARQRRAELKQQLKALAASEPQPAARVEAWMGLELQRDPPAAHFLDTGSYDRPLHEVSPGVPAVVLAAAGTPLPAAEATGHTSGRRAALARWLVDPKNPLVARVIVNRLWQGHFGRGLVENASDFGVAGGAPSHPEVIDFLSAELVASGWSLKAIQRLIVTSEVYRQSSARSPGTLAADRENRLYGAFPRHRLPAESVRDAMLAASGRLAAEMYGPGVRPPLPPNYSARESWEVTPEAAQHARRSVYIFAKRNLPYPLLAAFDLPDMNLSCPNRPTTITAPQSLMLLNSEIVLSFAASLASRVKTSAGEDPRAQVALAHRLALSRAATEREIESGMAFLADPGAAPGEALVDYCHVLLNTHEFLYPE